MTHTLILKSLHLSTYTTSSHLSINSLLLIPSFYLFHLSVPSDLLHFTPSRADTGKLSQTQTHRINIMIMR